MTTSIVCSHCRAPVKDDAWINCPYCGTLLSKPVLNPNKAVTARERFEAARRAPEVVQWMRHTPGASSVEIPLGIVTLVLAVVCVAIMFFTLSVAVREGWSAFFPAAIGVVALALLVVQIGRVRAFATAPLERHFVVWRDERTQVSGGGKHTSTWTTHYALLENGEGERIEYRVNAKLAGAHAPGDIGMAFVRGGYLLDFRRIDV